MGTVEDARWDEVEEAVEMLTVGELDEAIEALTAVVAKSPENELAEYYLGNALFEKEKYDLALKHYVRALELAPRFVAAMVGAGQTLRFLGQHEKALRIAREALAVKADDPDALYLAGCVCFQRGEKHQSSVYLSRFLETGPEIEIALEVKGMLRVLKGEVDPAVDEAGLDDDE